jgi:hypothetical protein
MLYTMHFPTETILVCWFLPMQMRWLMVIYLVWDLHPLLLTLSGDNLFTGVGHAAHLGGCAFGFLYAKYQWRLEPLLEWIDARRRRLGRRPPLRLVRSTLGDSKPEVEASDVDKLLQKIIESGQSSLTDEELAVLRYASERLKQRPPSPPN